MRTRCECDLGTRASHDVHMSKSMTMGLCSGIVGPFVAASETSKVYRADECFSGQVRLTRGKVRLFRAKSMTLPLWSGTTILCAVALFCDREDAC